MKKVLLLSFLCSLFSLTSVAQKLKPVCGVASVPQRVQHRAPAFKASAVTTVAGTPILSPSDGSVVKSLTKIRVKIEGAGLLTFNTTAKIQLKNSQGSVVYTFSAADNNIVMDWTGSDYSYVDLSVLKADGTQSAITEDGTYTLEIPNGMFVGFVDWDDYYEEKVLCKTQAITAHYTIDSNYVDPNADEIDAYANDPRLFVPAGKKTSLSMNCDDWDALRMKFIPYEGYQSGIAYDVNNPKTVYLYGLFSAGADMQSTRTWLRGTVDGDIITITPDQEVWPNWAFHQHVIVKAARMKGADDFLLRFELTEEPLQFRLLADGGIESVDKELILMAYLESFQDDNVTVDEENCGVFTCNRNHRMFPVNDPVAVPEDAVIKDYCVHFYDYSDVEYKSFIKVGMTDDAVYFQGLFEDVPDAWIKGDFNADKTRVTFKSGQFLGESVSLLQFYGAEIVDWDHNYDPAIPLYGGVDEISLAYDAQTGRFTSADDYAFSMNTVGSDTEYMIIWDFMKYLDVKPFVDRGAVKPAAPEVTAVMDFRNYNGIDFGYRVEFIAPDVDVDGNELPCEKLYYRFYTDEKTPYVFYNTAHPYIKEQNPTEMSYLWKDGWDFFLADGIGNMHNVYIFNGNYPRRAGEFFGLQMLYKYGEQMVGSDIVWYNFEGDPIEIEGIDGVKVNRKGNGKAYWVSPLIQIKDGKKILVK